ncbi:MAG: 5'/3'-nucleotidase SurE [Myxococcales bacterium]|nr:5'/3'-nucleotidase SurE [Myxococcales bacterium]
MRLLLTNDDGFHAPGLDALARIAGRLGEVWVVAPDTERSGVSHAITLFKPLRLREVGPRRFVCDGTPTDCVHLAINQLQLAPDVVLAGINPGPNLGHDVLYSGTVAGALEGFHWDVPSVALSHCASSESELDAVADRLADLLGPLIETARSLRLPLNVNLPPIGGGEWLGVRVTRLGQRYYSNEVIERNDPRGRMYYWIGGSEVTMPDIAGSDCNAVRDGYVSVTPLGDDLTRHAALSNVAHTLGTLLGAGLDVPTADTPLRPSLRATASEGRLPSGAKP